MIYEENKLKEKLIKIQNNNYLPEKEEDYFTFGLEMLENIGSLDPILRDELIYGILFHWILENKFTFEELKELLEISIDKEHLSYKLYEKDVRGYVEVKGWAHSAAHTADALDELVKCSFITRNDLLDILNAIKTKVCIGYHVFIEEENERLVNVVETLFNKNILSDLEITNWLNEFELIKPKASYIQNMHLKVNVKGFLRTLYFRLITQDNFTHINEEIKKIILNLK